jgi:hypothetical protein
MRTFLTNLILTALLVGIPTLVIWLRSGRKLPLKTSYYRALLHVFRFSAAAIVLISGLILMFATSDLIGLTGFGYPVFSVPFLMLLILVGVGLWRITSFWIRSPKHLQMSKDSQTTREDP